MTHSAEQQAAPQSNKALSAKDILTLYERLQALRWSKGFDGSFAECFCALLSILERNKTVRDVIEIMPHFDDRFGLVDILNAMVNLGQHAEKRKLGAKAAISAPALVLLDNGVGKPPRPVVILQIDDEGEKRLASVYDSESRTVERIDLNESRDFRRGVFYVFEKQKQQRDENAFILRAGAGFGWFRALAIRFYRVFAQIFCLSLFINILGLSTPLFIMLVYDRVIAARVVEAFPYLVAGVIAAIICDWCLRKIRARRLAWVAARIDSIVGNVSFSRLMKLSVKTSDNVSVTAQLLRLRSFESLRDFFNSVAFSSVMELPFSAIYLVVIFLLGGPLVVVPLICVGLYGLLFFMMRKRIGVEIRRAARTGAASQRFLLETFEKTQDIVATGLSEKWLKKYDALAKREYKAFNGLSYAGNVTETLAHGVTMFGGLATLSFGAVLNISGSLSAGAMIACLILTWRTLTPFHNFCAVIQRFEQIKNSVMQIDSLMDIAEQEQRKTSGAAIKSLRGGIVFERAGLRLGERKSPLLMDVTFTASPGEVIGFTGPSGCGKSLILKLVQGIYEPTYGAVRVDGFDLRQLDLEALRKQISYIPQQPQLFSGSIEENIRLVRPEASVDEIWRALDAVGASEHVASLPDGIQTHVLKDRRLSVDLLMQISMARAYLLNSGVYLIDELPNALMMSECGLRLKFFIRENMRKKTILVASQNEELLSLCDRIYTVTRYGLKSVEQGASDGNHAMERVA